MTATIIPLRNRAHGGVLTEIVPSRISRHDAARLFAVARANGLSPAAVTENNIAIVADFNLFREYGLSSRSGSEPRP
jgi:hypothetical protein